MLLEKVLGTENPGDALTKYLSAPDLRAHLARMGLQVEEGRAVTAPALTTSVVKCMQAHYEDLWQTKQSLQGSATVAQPQDSLPSSEEAEAQSLACPVPVPENLPLTGEFKVST